MNAKKNKLATLKALLSGDITVDQVVNKVKLIFTTDSLDEPLTDAAVYMRLNETTKKAAKKKKTMKNAPETAPLPESPANAPQVMHESRPRESTMIFSTEPDRYEGFRRQLETSINQIL